MNYFEKIENKEWTNELGETFKNSEEIEEKIREYEKGCDEAHEEDEDEMCQYGNLCEFCSDLVQNTEKLRSEASEWENKIKNETWIDAKYEFIKKAEEYGFDCIGEIEEQLEENKIHCGGLTDTILSSYDTEEEKLDMVEEDIEHIIRMLDISSERHNDTNYDELLSKGVGRETAREIIK